MWGYFDRDCHKVYKETLITQQQQNWKGKVDEKMYYIEFLIFATTVIIVCCLFAPTSLQPITEFEDTSTV